MKIFLVIHISWNKSFFLVWYNLKKFLYFDVPLSFRFILHMIKFFCLGSDINKTYGKQILADIFPDIWCCDQLKFRNY